MKRRCLMSSSRRRGSAIDRVVPGVGRITIRAARLAKAARTDLDRAIVRAAEAGHLQQLRMLKKRHVSPVEFLEASLCGRLAALKPPGPSSPELRPLVEKWLKSADLRESSRARYAQSWAPLYAAMPAQPLLENLTVEWWHAFAASRRERVGNATLNRDRAAVLAFRSWAEQQGYSLPLFKTQRLVEEPEGSGILTPDQVGLVQRLCRRDRWPFFWTLLVTGARQGEVLNLRAFDVSRVPPLITIRSQAGSKSRGRSRAVPIPDDLAMCLASLTAGDDDRVFPYSRHTVNRWWGELAKSAGLTRVTLHGLRATFVTIGLENGVVGPQMQRLVGHANLSTTMRYHRLTDISQQAAARAVAALGLAGNRTTSQHSSQQGAASPGPILAPAAG
jgi:integrase